MITRKVLSHSLFIPVFIATSMCTLQQLSAMDQGMSSFELKLKACDEELTDKIMSELPSLKVFPLKLQDIILEISVCLESNRKNPKAVVILIDQLSKLFGHGKSVSLLRRALESAKMDIGDINLYSQTNTCGLYHDCLQSAWETSYLIKSCECIKIILYVAGNKAFDLISKQESFDGLTVWHHAVLMSRDVDDANVFINWAVDTDNISSLLSLKAKNGRTALHFAAKSGYVTIFKRLLEEADKIDGLVKKLLYDKDNQLPFDGRELTVLDCANESLNNRKEILNIVQSYSERYQLTDLLS